MGSRSLPKAASAIETLKNEVPESTNTVEPVQVDLTSDDSIEKAFEQIKASPGRLDVLVNNAGAAFNESPDKVSLREAFTKSYDVNVAGTHVLTSIFMPLLLASPEPRLLFIAGLANQTQAAKQYFPTPPLPAGWPKNVDFETIPYRCSKTALNMLMLDWNHKLQADGVKVWAVGPGFLETDLGGMREMAKKMGTGHASIGGKFITSVVEGERDADVGKIVIRDGISTP